MRLMIALSLSALLVAPACGGDDDDGGNDPDGGGGGADSAVSASATVDITGISGQTVTGTGTFTTGTGGVTLAVNFTEAPAGTHGMHIHQSPACGNDGMDAGAHWDPVSSAPEDHGLPPDGHLGDLGNVTIADDGTGSLTITKQEWSVGDGSDTDVVPHAIIFHEAEDDGSMPSAGGRWGCGVISAD